MESIGPELFRRSGSVVVVPRVVRGVDVGVDVGAGFDEPDIAFDASGSDAVFDVRMGWPSAPARLGSMTVHTTG